jgi:hypothetical protein
MVSQSDRLPMMTPTRGDSAIAVMSLKKGDIIQKETARVEPTGSHGAGRIDPGQGPDCRLL